MKFFAKIQEITQLVFRKGSKEVVVEPATQTGSGPITITIPDVGDNADTVVMNDTAATLTNKTISAASNTITNITNSSISATADIDTSKVKAAANNHVVISSGTGTLSTEATLAKSRGGTGADNSSVTFPSTGTIVTEAGSQALTNKTIDSSLNTLSNIVNANISSSAAITADKLDVRDTAFIIKDATDSTKQFKFDSAGTASTALTLRAVQPSNITVTLPSSNTFLVGTDTLDQLSNKGLDDGSTRFYNSGSPTKQVSISAANVTAGQTRTLTMPDANVDLAALTNSNISASAAIALNKLAATTASRALVSDASGFISASSVTSTELGYLSGVTSAIQTQLGNKAASGANSDITSLSALSTPLSRTQGGTGITSTATFPSSGTIATTSNKLSAFAATTSAELAGVISDETGSGALVFGTGPTISAPAIDQVNYTASASAAAAAGKYAVYVNSADGKLHVANSDSSTDVAVGSSSSGRNYLSDWYDGTKNAATGLVNSIGDTLASSTRSSNTDKWGSSDTSKLTISTVADSSALREGSSFNITHVGAGVAFIETPLFSLDVADRGKPVMVSFDVNGLSTADEYQAYIVRYSSGTLTERISVAGTASATSPNSAQIPTGTTTFRGFFVSSSLASQQYGLRFYRNSGTTSPIRLDSLYVGPQSVTQGAAVTDWQSYTATNSNSTNASTTTQYRRVGDSIQIMGRVAWSGAGSGSTLTITLPTGLTADTNKYAGGSSTDVILGQAQFYDSGVALYQMSVYPASTTTLGFWFSSANVTFDGSQGGASDVLTFEATIPISNWSSNVTMADRAVEAYLSYDDSAATTANTTYNTAAKMVYGASGSPFYAIASTTAAQLTKYRITPQQTLQSTDLITLEISTDSGKTWSAASNSSNIAIYSNQADAFYGMYCNPNYTSNYIEVGFGNKGRIPSETAATAYAANGRTWNDLAGGTYKWRIRVVSGGAAVGFPVSARNIVGDTSGTTVPSGYIGEKIDFTPRSVTCTNSSTWYANSSALVTLQPGTYLIFGYVGFDLAAGATDISYSFLATNSTNDSSGGIYGVSTAIQKISAAGTANDTTHAMVPSYVSYSTPTSLYAKAYFEDTSGQVAAIGGFAVRIA